MMNQAIQLDLHPDAESLNAFAEQALPEQERGQILEHLGVCDRCRQVVYLAQEMAVDAVPVARAAVVRTAPRKTSWFGNGWFTWAPAAALAGIVGFAVFIHFRPAGPGSEVAGVTPQNGGGVPNPGRQRPAEAEVTPSPAAPRAARPSGGDAHAEPPVITSQEPRIAAVPAPGIPAEPASNTGTNAERAVAAPAPGASEYEFEPSQAGVQGKPGTAVAAWQQQQARPLSKAATKAEADKAGMDTRASRAESNQGMPVGSAAPQPQYDVQPAPSSSYDRNAAPSTSGTIAQGFTRKITLPSGLGAASFATAQHLLLALDTSGGLYLSQDFGSHWAAVSHQWTGRAVSVRLESGQSGPAPNNTAAERFEIVNDMNQVWVSTDGRYWKAK